MNMPIQEVWKPVIFRGVETGYKVSNLGRISGIRKEFITPVTDRDGYQIFSLHIDGSTRYNAKIHRVVAEAFIPNPKNKPQVNHKDGNKQNNAVTNLEWVSVAENNLHACATGLRTTKCGIDSPLAKHTEEEIRMACQLLTEHVSMYQIAERLHMHVSDLSRLKNGDIWKHISKDYDLSSNIKSNGIPIRLYSKELKRDVSGLIHMGFGRKEIKDGLDLPDTKSVNDMIRGVQERDRKRLELGSTTIL